MNQAQMQELEAIYKLLDGPPDSEPQALLRIIRARVRSLMDSCGWLEANERSPKDTLVPIGEVFGAKPAQVVRMIGTKNGRKHSFMMVLPPAARLPKGAHPFNDVVVSALLKVVTEVLDIEFAQTRVGVYNIVYTPGK